jgi:hypothetical protein
MRMHASEGGGGDSGEMRKNCSKKALKTRLLITLSRHYRRDALADDRKRYVFYANDSKSVGGRTTA